MGGYTRRVTGSVASWIAVVVLAGCAAGPKDSSPTAPQTPTTVAAPSRITAAMLGEPRSLVPGVGVGGIRGLEAIDDLLDAGLSTRNDHGALVPHLGVAVPNTDDGSWQLFPDGTMETTWTIRPGAVWHDGAPLTAQDLVFTLTLYGDKRLEFASSRFADIDGARALDDRTVVVHWKSPNIAAAGLFARGADELGLPLPSHLLEASYGALDPQAFMAQDYFTGTGFVGTGPYIPREWVKGSQLVLGSFADYVLGRPRIDEIVVKFISDTDTVLANVLAGAVDVTFGKTLSNEQAVEARARWAAGHVEVAQANTINIYPQHLTPNPPVVAQQPFLQAALEGIDRQQLVGTLLGGLSEVADSMVGPDDPEFPAVDSRITRYPYDPRAAMQLIAGLGYALGPDGFFVSEGGDKLTVELRTVDVDINTKAQLAIADAWQHIGLATQPYVVPPALQTGPARGQRAAFPAFDMERGGADLASLPNFLSANIATPENNWAGQFRTRYKSAALDSLITRYESAIPLAERNQALGDVVAYMTQHLVMLPLFHDVEPTMISNRLVNAHARNVASSNTWNVEQWALQ